jgi:hypothetical protein
MQQHALGRHSCTPAHAKQAPPATSTMAITAAVMDRCEWVIVVLFLNGYVPPFFSIFQ